MLQKQTLQFLTDLKANNNKPWFDENKKPYNAAKADFLALVTDALKTVEGFDEAVAKAALSPKDCLFRINRDVRFSADKSPYKTSFSAYINDGGKKAPTAGYFMNIEPGNTFAGGGMFMPEPDTLARLRQEIDYDFPAFQKMLDAPAFKKPFGDLSREGSLKNAPKGYETDNPAIEYLKLKSFTAMHTFADDELTKPDFGKQLADVFAGIQPLVAFLNRALVTD